MTTQITKNNRTFEIEATPVDCRNYKISVFEIFSDGRFNFIGKAVSNDIGYAAIEVIKGVK